MYDFLKFFHTIGAKKVPLIIQYNNFEFDSDYKCKVHCKTGIAGNGHVIFSKPKLDLTVFQMR